LNTLYGNPTRRVIASGALKYIPDILSDLRAKSVLLICGQKSFKQSKYYEELKGFLKPFKLVEAPPVPKEPSLSFLKQHAESCLNQSFDVVVAVGGGSVMDVAKMVALIKGQESSRQKKYLDDLEHNRDFSAKAVDLISIPTTSGTGSEVTLYASFDNAERKKISISHKYLYPAYAVVDPLLMVSMPPQVTASTGFDVLSQSIEAYWSIHHIPSSDTHALRAIPLVMESLLTAYKEPEDLNARFNMALAANEAGLAIAHTRTTAVHSVSYPITTLFGVPHGHACALTLASFINFNTNAIPPERAKALWNACGVSDAKGTATRVNALMDSMGLERRLSVIGIDRDGIEKIVENGFRPDRVKNNPRKLEVNELREMLTALT